MQSIILFAALSLAGCGLIATSSTAPHVLTTSPTPEVRGDSRDAITMPNLIGMTEAQAAAAVKAAGIVLTLDSSGRIECENAPKTEGLVNCQAPAAGSTVQHNTLVQVVVYQDHTPKGEKDSRLLRTLIGLTPDAAKAKVESWHRGWKVMIVTPSTSGGGGRYDAACGDNKVCGIANLGQGGYETNPIQLEVNAKTTIAAPPPD